MLDRSDLRTLTHTPDVSGFAIKALSVLAREVRQQHPAAKTDHVSRFLLAAKQPDRSGFARLVKDLRMTGLSDYELVLNFLPQVANRLGDDWIADRASFAEVTIGSARLQGLLHQIAADWPIAKAGAPRCLVMTPPKEQHTLGATTLATQLRMQGVDAQLELDVSHPETKMLVARGDYSVIMISSYDGNNLAPLTEMIRWVKEGNAKVPVIIGGYVSALRNDVCDVVGADYATNDLNEAVKMCNFGRQDNLCNIQSMGC